MLHIALPIVCVTIIVRALCLTTRCDRLMDVRMLLNEADGGNNEEVISRYSLTSHASSYDTMACGMW